SQFFATQPSLLGAN
ncbi:hypothetical protein D018_4547B, partial [Vibrio parahaemolyticus VP2007-007]